MAMEKIVYLIFCIGISLLLNKADALLTEEIVGGEESPEGEFTYVVSIEADGQHQCNGGILDDMLVAAVSHCIINYETAQLHQKSYRVVVTADFSSLESTIASAPVEKVYLPETFNVDVYSGKAEHHLDQDFLIFKLKHGLGIDSNPQLKALQLPRQSELGLDGSYVVAGHGVYGRTSRGRLAASDGKLRYAEAEIMTNDRCGELLQFPLEPFFLCARVKQIAGKDRGTCRGDEGLPLVQDGSTIVGVLLHSSSIGDESTYPSTYLRISHYLTFIEKAKRGDTSNMRVYSLILTEDAGYMFRDDTRFNLKKKVTSLFRLF